MTNTEQFRLISKYFDIPYATVFMNNVIKFSKSSTSTKIQELNDTYQKRLNSIGSDVNNVFLDVDDFENQEYDTIIFVAVGGLSRSSSVINQIKHIIDEYDMVPMSPKHHRIDPCVDRTNTRRFSHYDYRIVKAFNNTNDRTNRINIGGKSISSNGNHPLMKSVYALLCCRDKLEDIAASFNENKLSEYVVNVLVPLVGKGTIEHQIANEYFSRDLLKGIKKISSKLKPSLSNTLWMRGKMQDDINSVITQTSIDFHDTHWPDISPVEHFTDLLNSPDRPMMVSFSTPNTIKTEAIDRTDMIVDLVGKLYTEKKAYFARRVFNGGTTLKGGKVVIASSEVVRFIKMLKVYGFDSSRIIVEYALTIE